MATILLLKWQQCFVFVNKHIRRNLFFITFWGSPCNNTTNNNNNDNNNKNNNYSFTVSSTLFLISIFHAIYTCSKEYNISPLQVIFHHSYLHLIPRVPGCTSLSLHSISDHAAVLCVWRRQYSLILCACASPTNRAIKLYSTLINLRLRYVSMIALTSFNRQPATNEHFHNLSPEHAMKHRMHAEIITNTLFLLFTMHYIIINTITSQRTMFCVHACLKYDSDDVTKSWSRTNQLQWFQYWLKLTFSIHPDITPFILTVSILFLF